MNSFKPQDGWNTPKNQALEMCTSTAVVVGNYHLWGKEPFSKGCYSAQNDLVFYPWILLKKPRETQKWFGQILTLDFRPFLGYPLQQLPKITQSWTGTALWGMVYGWYDAKYVKICPGALLADPPMDRLPLHWKTSPEMAQYDPPLLHPTTQPNSKQKLWCR